MHPDVRRSNFRKGLLACWYTTVCTQDRCAEADLQLEMDRSVIMATALDRHWYDGTSHALRRKLLAGKSFQAGVLRSVGKLECRRSSLQSLQFAQGIYFRRPSPGQSAFGVEKAVLTRDHGGRGLTFPGEPPSNPYQKPFAKNGPVS